MTADIPFFSPYSPNTDSERETMLEAIGISSVDDLFKDIPRTHRNPSVNLPPPMSEITLNQYAQELASTNVIPGDYSCFLGAGSYRHHIPAMVGQLAGRGEFLTAYTPYQPEVSQGTLQIAYEFQSLVCQLTGMDVANAGMYDGSTSLAEAILMAARLTNRDRIAVLDTVSPLYREVIGTYSQAPGLRLDKIGNGVKKLAEDTACIVVQQPNFFGYMEDLVSLGKLARANSALLVVYSDPISLGLFRPPGDFAADIVVAEGQAMGVPMSFGGPYLGIFACKQRFVRQMPGRIVGKTVDTGGRTAYVLTLQAREQHIRREKATSNICTSVALIGLMATAFMASYGKRGFRRLAELCYHNAHYAAKLISEIPGYSLPLTGTFFREFVVKCPLPPSEINKRLLEYHIIGGLDISEQIDNGMLLCATEINSRKEIERLTTALADIGAK